LSDCSFVSDFHFVRTQACWTSTHAIRGSMELECLSTPPPPTPPPACRFASRGQHGIVSTTASPLFGIGDLTQVGTEIEMGGSGLKTSPSRIPEPEPASTSVPVKPAARTLHSVKSPASSASPSRTELVTDGSCVCVCVCVGGGGGGGRGGG
jgi:hypothetical protein